MRFPCKYWGHTSDGIITGFACLGRHPITQCRKCGVPLVGEHLTLAEDVYDKLNEDDTVVKIVD